MTNQRIRQDFLKSLVAAAAALAAARGWSAATPVDKYKELQTAIDQVMPDDYRLYRKKGVKELSTPAQKFVFGRLDAAFDKVLKEVRETVVTGPKPVVWLVCNIDDFVIYHTGDCCNVQKLNPTRRPDLWIVHPYCGMKVADGVKRFKPVRTVVAHINELGHAKGHARWTWNNAFKAKADVEAAGGEAVVPIWGDRIQ